jgi:hypothetical protein
MTAFLSPAWKVSIDAAQPSQAPRNRTSIAGGAIFTEARPDDPVAAQHRVDDVIGEGGPDGDKRRRIALQGADEPPQHLAVQRLDRAPVSLRRDAGAFSQPAKIVSSRSMSRRRPERSICCAGGDIDGVHGDPQR